jgi:hypothetical protein
LLREEVVTELAGVGDNRIFCVIGNTIYSIDYDGGDRQLVLTMDGPISNMSADEILVFFVVDEYIYRHHIPSDTTDRLCHAPGILDGSLFPLNNHTLRWETAEPNPSESFDLIRYFSYTGPIGEIMEINRFGGNIN